MGSLSGHARARPCRSSQSSGREGGRPSPIRRGAAPRSSRTSVPPGTAQGQPITVEGTSSGADNLFVTRDGVYLGGVLNNAAAIKFTLVASGMEIGRTQNQTTTIARVK